MKNMNTVQGTTTLPSRVEQAKTLDHVKPVQRVGAYAILAMLSIYTIQLIHSAGDISVQEKNLIIVASALTLLVVIPIIVLNVFFVSRRRTSNATAKYSSRSAKKMVVVWAIPIVMVAVLSCLSWGTIHSLKPIDPKVTPVHVAVAGA
jgi:cytochrome o ubiquinol oxidase subunit 2